MKKKILVIALSLALVATLSMGSLAWFTDSDSIKNDFYVGDTNTDPDKVFGLDVWETVDNQEIGRGDKTGAGTSYEAILPGQVLSKAPVLENTGIHPMYVRAFVTVSGADILIDAMGGFDWTKTDLFLAGLNTTEWTMDDVLYTADNTLVYVFTYNTALAAKTVSAPLFDSVVIPTGLTKEQAAELDSFSVSVSGQAIQSEHILCNNAVDAFAKYWDAEGTIFGYAADAVEILVLNGRVLKLAETPADLGNLLATATAGDTIVLSDAASYGIVEIADDLTDVVIDAAGNDSVQFTIKSGVVLEDVVIKNLDLAAYNGQGSYGGAVSIEAAADVEITFEDCTFRPNSGYSGVRSFTEAAELTFVNCTFEGGRYAFYKSGAPIKSLVFDDCTFRAQSSWIAQSHGGTEAITLSVTDCTFEGCTGGLFKCSGAYAAGSVFTFANNTLDANCTGHDGNPAKFFELNVTNATTTVSGNTLAGADWNPDAACGLVK